MKQSVTQDSTEREYIQCLYSAMSGHTRSAQTFTCKLHHACLLFRNRSPDRATPKWGGRHLMGACYSFIDPERMRGWVGLVGWPIADGLPT